MAAHRLDPAPTAVTQVFRRDAPAALTVDPGDTVVVRSLDAWGHLERPVRLGEGGRHMFAQRRGHCLTGPIAVRGAEPGMTLAVHLGALRPDGWGWTAAATGDSELNRRLGLAPTEATFLRWEIDPDGLTGVNDRGLSVDLAPFLGVIGMPPDEPGEHSTVPPRPHGGGNIDCRELVAGSTLYLPVTVPGAMLCLGDGHAAQGDGEVSGTAIECGMTAEIRLDLAGSPPVQGIHAVTPAGRVTFGFSADLNEATTAALADMVTWLESLCQVDRAAALGMASVAVSLRVTQVANQTWGVHALLPHGAIRGSAARTAPSGEPGEGETP